jgi:hypothetical protein
VFGPICRRWGAAWAVMAVFLTSGLVHELVISVPAGAGYGLPTAYFAVQGLGVLMERKSTSRLITLLVIAVPVFWLFHPPFVHRVIIFNVALWLAGIGHFVVLIAFGTLTLFLHDKLLQGDRAAVGLAVFIRLFWLMRLVIDFGYHTHADWPRGTRFVIAHLLLTSLFLALTATYLGLVGWHGWRG